MFYRRTRLARAEFDDEIGIQVIKVNQKLIWMLGFDIPVVECSVGKVP